MDGTLHNPSTLPCESTATDVSDIGVNGLGLCPQTQTLEPPYETSFMYRSLPEATISLWVFDNLALLGKGI